MIRKLTKYLKSKPEIEFGYLFGSVARGQINKLSDIDVAIYLNKKIKPDDYFEYKLNLLQELSDLLKTEYVDLVILNEENYVLNYQVLKTGKLLFAKNEKLNFDYIIRTLKMYFDFQYLNEKIMRCIIERCEKQISI